MIYLDNSATTKPYPEVVEVVGKVMETYYGNPSSLHQRGVEAEQVMKQARQIAAKALLVKPGEIYFTSGGTESNNTAIKGVAMEYRGRGKHIITTQIEHPAVYDVCGQLEQFGYDVTYLPADADGRISVEDLKQAVRPDTILVSVMHVNNELGTVQPIEEIGAYLKQFPKIVFHVDAVQSFGKVPFLINQWGIDLLSISAHKFHGPRGVGILFKREGLKIQPLLIGGGQEAGVRSGTENLAAIAGMAKAIRIMEEKREKAAALYTEMTTRLRKGIESIPGCIINTPAANTAPHILNFSVPGVKAEVLLHTLEEAGFLVSTRSACSSKLNEPSRVLMATGMGRERALSAIRLSVGADNRPEEMDQFVEVLRDAVQRLRPYMNV
ncbi:cysteine desulfurase [Brevibacillus humidisoli]|uniref:cysteine desulfurase family protein n=1 Tax=Brevibacillus humidisoli TaxID=2895522 RepID=UPI001E474BBC|nr:cysteine desulfurase family protein [Brevibacillus humidisoli]UFJ41610.1 cysteine desulfurase [Brevibacillus humidisoli]